MILMCLDVGAELFPYMIVIVDIPPGHDEAWRVLLGRPILLRECIQPKHTIADKMYQD